MAEQPVFSADLANVEVGETAICDVRGDIGELRYRGYSVVELADKPFETIVWLLIFGNWPNDIQLTAFKKFLAYHRQLEQAEIQLLQALPSGLHPMLVLQSIIPALAPDITDRGELSDDAALGLAIAAKIPALIAAWHRISQHQLPVTADASLSSNADFLKMFHGRVPDVDAVRTLDSVQILQLEHSLNVSTFVGRVATGTGAPLQSVIAASVGTLFGPVHGGADQAALEMAREVGSPANAEAFVSDSLARKAKIMGMGHREYRIIDPRATVLKPMAQALCKNTESRQLLDTLAAIEAACQRAFEKRGKQIHANMEFYKGAVFHSLGIPDDYFTALFTMSRVYGWVAHYLEFKPNSRLIRPRARYIGPTH